jgi:hypothetical protein
MNFFNKQFRQALGYSKTKFPQKKKVFVDQKKVKKQISEVNDSENYSTHIFNEYKEELKKQYK